MAYSFEPYDVLQIDRGNGWQDLSTLRTVDEGIQAVKLVYAQSWDGKPASFRIVGSTCQRPVKLSL